MKCIIHGVVAGLVGTTVMTGAMLVLKRARMAPGELAPKEVTGNFEERLGVRRYLPEPVFEASWVLMHFGYGATSGVVYALAQERVPDLQRPGVIGTLFGVLLWVASYCGWLPIFGLYPSPTQLSKRKIVAELITTHLIYGTATVVTHHKLRSPSRS